MSQTAPMPKFVKIFIDGQNFYNRLKDFNFEIEDINYNSLFEFIIDIIQKDRLEKVQFLKAEWYDTGNNIHRSYNYREMRLKHLDAHIPNKEGGLWQVLLDAKGNKKPNLTPIYDQIFMHEKGIDDLVLLKIKERVEATEAALKRIEEKYKGKGAIIKGLQLDLIYLRFCGFLKFDYYKRTGDEKGVDVAIASQMIASVMDTSSLQNIRDESNIIPDYNSDILVLISTDNDFLETLRILHAMQKPVYVVFVQKHVHKKLVSRKISQQILITKNDLIGMKVSERG